MGVPETVGPQAHRVSYRAPDNDGAAVVSGSRVVAERRTRVSLKTGELDIQSASRSKRCRAPVN